MNVNTSVTRSVLVTGTSSGIGRATALMLAREGFEVFAGIRSPADGESLLSAANGTLTPVIIDVTDVETITAAVELISAAVGPRGLSALVNNAGVGLTGPIETVNLGDLRHQYEVNVFGQVAVIQAFLPLLRASAGRLLNVGSIGDRLGLPFGGPLASSKWAIAAITESLRVELRPWGIDVVLIEPASIKTDAVGKAESGADDLLLSMNSVDRGHYGQAYRAMITRFMAMERKGSSPDVVARAILRALTASRPRARYLAGKDGHLLAFMARWAPDRLFDRIKIQLFGLPHGFGGAPIYDLSANQGGSRPQQQEAAR